MLRSTKILSWTLFPSKFKFEVWISNNPKALLLFKWERNAPVLNWQDDLVLHQMMCTQQNEMTGLWNHSFNTSFSVWYMLDKPLFVVSMDLPTYLKKVLITCNKLPCFMVRPFRVLRSWQELALLIPSCM